MTDDKLDRRLRRCRSPCNPFVSLWLRLSLFSFVFFVFSVAIRLPRNPPSAHIDIKTERRKYGSVKTTIDIPDVLYRRAKIKAAQRGTSLKQLVLDSLEQSLGLRPPPAKAEKADFDVNEIGFPVYRRRGKGVVTDDFLNELREQEGI
jgi:hypothetical protein